MLRVVLLTALIAAVLVLVFAPAAAAECFNQFVCCWTFGSTGSGPGQFQGPRGMRFDWDSRDYLVVDSGNNRVQVLHETQTDDWLTFVRQIGSWGSGAGELSNPTGIELHGSTLIVVDTGNHRIQQFTLNGTYLGQIGHFGRGDGEFDSPQFAAVIDDTLYVTDAGNHRVQKFTLGGEYVGQWGSEGTGPGQFLSPSGIAAGQYPGHDIAVGDRERGVIQVFTTSGILVSTQAAPGVEGLSTSYGYWVPQTETDFVVHSACEGLAPGKAVQIDSGGMFWFVFTDFSNDRLVFWWFASGVERTTWGALKTRYRD